MLDLLKVLCVSCLLFVSGCILNDSKDYSSNTSLPNTIYAKDYYPLNIGAQWKYDCGTNTKVTDTIVGDKTIDGVRWFIVERFFDHYDSLQIFMTIKENNIWIATESEGVLIDETRYYYRFDLPVGQTWSVDIQSTLLDSGTCVISEKTETITVPAGTYKKCICFIQHLTYKDDTYEIIKTWFAPNVGLVKVQVLEADSDWNIINNYTHPLQTLTSYYSP